MTNQNPYDLGSILIDMGILTERRLEELITKYESEGSGTFNKFLIKEKEINYDQLRVALLKRKVA